MLSKSELEALAEKYEAKASRAYMNYQETGIPRYDREMTIMELKAKLYDLTVGKKG